MVVRYKDFSIVRLGLLSTTEQFFGIVRWQILDIFWFQSLLVALLLAH